MTQNLEFNIQTPNNNGKHLFYWDFNAPRVWSTWSPAGSVVCNFPLFLSVILHFINNLHFQTVSYDQGLLLYNYAFCEGPPPEMLWKSSFSFEPKNKAKWEREHVKDKHCWIKTPLKPHENIDPEHQIEETISRFTSASFFSDASLKENCRFSRQKRCHKKTLRIPVWKK